MRRIRIDFATPTVARAVSRAPVWVWPALVVALALAGMTARTSSMARAEQSAIQADIDALARKLAAREVRQQAAPVAVLTPSQVQATNAAVAALNVPWSATFNALEAVADGSVALLEVSLDPKNRVIRGVAEARRSDTMLAFIERMNARSVFSAARLVKHEVPEDDAQQALRFEFEVLWTAAAP